MLDLFTELKAVSAALAEAGIAHALVGGLAYSVWVEVRGTEDIDLLVRPEDWERIPAALAPLGYRELAGPMDFAGVRIRRLTKIQEGDVLVVDFLLADGPLVEGLERKVALEHEGHTYAVAPPHVIIALKKGRMSDQDRLDIAALSKLIEGPKP
jgi:hypothetical protein